MQARSYRVFSAIGAEAMIRQMRFKLPLFFSVVAVAFKDRADLVAEWTAQQVVEACPFDLSGRVTGVNN
jgi:hypothetical protein